jgi:phosphoribosylglycinamide formyltransferase-1
VSGRARVAVLVSGHGSNLQALIDASRDPDYPAQIAVVISNKATAFALKRAQVSGIPAYGLDGAAYAGRGEFEDAALEKLAEHQVRIVCLAGFMRILSARFLQRFAGPVLNIHPALLPSFPGLHAARQALEHGVKITGCTVHFVDAGTDSGPILAQTAVPVLPGDDEATLSARIQQQEHRLYPAALRWVAEGAASLEGRKVRIDGEPELSDHALRNPGRRLP